MTFGFESENAILVNYQDYHQELSIRMRNPPHPGLLLREYLGDMAVSAAAAHLRVTRVTLSRVLNGKAGVSASMALRLGAALGTSPDLWINMQAQHDLWRASGKHPAVRRFPHLAAMNREDRNLTA